MKTAAIKIRTYAHNVNIVNNNDLIIRAFRYLFLFLGVLAFCYIILLGNMVFNIVERRTFEAEARTLSNEVSNLELSYLSTSNKIDLSLSHTLGFKEIKPTFATRKSTKSLGSIKVANNEL